MRICAVTPQYPPDPGGVGYYAMNVHAKLIEKGHQVTVITRGPWSVGTHEEDVKGAHVKRVGFIPLYPFHINLHGLFVNKFFRSLESCFDVVHIHHPLAPFIHTSLPTMATVHSTMKTILSGLDSSFQTTANKMFLKFIYPSELKMLHSMSLVTSDSFTTAAKLETAYDIPPNTVEVVGNGVDIDFFVPRRDTDEFSYILYVGRLVQDKGLIDLAKSAEYVCRKEPLAKYIIIGAGPLRTSLMKLIRRMHLDNNILLIGTVDRKTLLRYYQNASLFVLPSYHESFPNTVLESMACGLPVVTTPVGDLPRVLKNGTTGFIVPVRQPEALADAVLSLMRDSKLRRNVGEASREEVVRNYSWDSLSDRIVKCYELAMSGRYAR